MEAKIKQPHILVCHEVQRQWSSHQYKSFWRWILELGEIKPRAIEVIQTSEYDNKHRMCTGDPINRWRYDRKGFQYKPAEEHIEEKIVEVCSFCIDKEQKRVLIVWSNILGSASSRKKMHYFGTGTLYEVVMKDGIEDYEVIGGWIE